MIEGLKRFTVQMVAGANVATIALMLLVGYSGHLNPAGSPWLTNAGLTFPAFILANLGFLIFWLVCKPKYALIAVAGFVVCYQPMRAYVPLNVPMSAPEGSIKVLSYNVWYYGGFEETEGVNPIIRYIADSEADIVCLQEAWPSEREQAQIDSLIHPRYPYRDSVRYNDSGVLAIYSRFPVKYKEKIDYTSKGNLSCAFTLDIEGEDVVVINNHLETTGLSMEDKAQFKEMVKGDMRRDSARMASRRLIDKLGEASRIRAPQARAVARYIRKHAYQSIICVGDFNDGPLSYAHRIVSDGLTDCYITSGNGPGISYHHSGFYVRIDNILCSDDWTPYGCKVDRQIKQSDHYPIYCWLKKRSKP